MDDINLKRALAIALSSYAKRWMEGGVYDRFMDSGLGQSLKGLNPKTKYGTEAGLYLLTAILEQKFSDETPIKAIIRQLTIDIGPEIAKRMLKGERESAQTDPAEPQAPVGQGNIPSVLLALEQDTLSDLLLWLSTIETEQRKRLIAGLGRLSAQELDKFVNMSTSERGQFARHVFGIEDQAAFDQVMNRADVAKQRILNGLNDTISKLRQGQKHQNKLESQPEANQPIQPNEHPAATQENNAPAKPTRAAIIEKQTLTSRRTILALWILLGVALLAMFILNR